MSPSLDCVVLLQMSPVVHFLERRSSDAGEKLCRLHHLLLSIQSILQLRWSESPAAAQIRHEIDGAVGASGVKLNVNKRKRKCRLPSLDVNNDSAASFTFTTSLGGEATCALVCSHV